MKKFKTNYYKSIPMSFHEEREFNRKSYFTDNTTGFKCWKEFDENGIMVYYKDSLGNESWCEYNRTQRLFYYKNSDGVICCKKYNRKGKLISVNFYI